MSPAIDTTKEESCISTCDKIDELIQKFNTTQDLLMKDHESVRKLQVAIQSHENQLVETSNAVASIKEDIASVNRRLTLEESFRLKMVGDMGSIQETLKNQNAVLGNIQGINQSQTDMVKKWGSIAAIILGLIQAYSAMKTPNVQQVQPNIIQTAHS